jgi:uncharacterized 2Fe-2S/4Fe-4S cluster protein (DUF4445 family)
MTVVLTQHDIRELQLAKAAIRTGIQVLLAANGRKEQELDQVIIAGAFGSYIDVASAVAIGMMPSLPLERFRQVGNAAGTGARMALISSTQCLRAQALASRVRYIELGSAPQFSETFLNACSLRPPSLCGERDADSSKAGSGFMTASCGSEKQGSDQSAIKFGSE